MGWSGPDRTGGWHRLSATRPSARQVKLSLCTPPRFDHGRTCRHCACFQRGTERTCYDSGTAAAVRVRVLIAALCPLGCELVWANWTQAVRLAETSREGGPAVQSHSMLSEEGLVRMCCTELCTMFIADRHALAPAVTAGAVGAAIRSPPGMTARTHFRTRTSSPRAVLVVSSDYDSIGASLSVLSPRQPRSTRALTHCRRFGLVASALTVSSSRT